MDGDPGNFAGGMEAEVVHLWVPGHSGLDGNKLTDRAAGKTATLHSEGNRQKPVSINYHAVKALIQRKVRGRPPEHDRSRQVFTGRTADLGRRRRTGALCTQLRLEH